MGSKGPIASAEEAGDDSEFEKENKVQVKLYRYRFGNSFLYNSSYLLSSKLHLISHLFSLFSKLAVAFSCTYLMARQILHPNCTNEFSRSDLSFLISSHLYEGKFNFVLPNLYQKRIIRALCRLSCCSIPLTFTLNGFCVIGSRSILLEIFAD